MPTSYTQERACTSREGARRENGEIVPSCTIWSITVLTQAVTQVSRLKGFPRSVCFSLTLNKLYGDWQRHGFTLSHSNLWIRIRIAPPVSDAFSLLSVGTGEHTISVPPTVLQSSDMPEMLIPLTSNRLVVFHHDPKKYSYRPAGDSLVIQTWLMSEPFAPDTLGEKIVSLSAEIQGERLHIISLMSRPPGNSFGPLALLDVYAGWYGHGDKGPSGTFRHRSVPHGG